MHKSAQFSIEAKCIGSIALEVLSKDQDALVMSNISKGIFIKSSSRWLIFISFDNCNSPLTLTLGEPIPLLSSVQAGTTVLFASGQLLVPQMAINILADHGRVWKPAPRPSAQASNADRQKRLEHFFQLLRTDSGVMNISAATVRAQGRNRPFLSAIVAYQAISLPMIGHADAAILAHKHMTATAAQKRTRITSAVQQNDRLLPALHAVFQPFLQSPRDYLAFAVSLKLLSHIDNCHLR